LQDKELNKIIGIPLRTLNDWKKSENYRRVLYEVLKGLPSKYLESVKKKLEEEDKLKNSLKKYDKI